MRSNLRNNFFPPLSHSPTSEPAVPNILAPGIGFVEDGFSTDWGGDGFRMIEAHYILLCTLFLFLLHQLHFRSSGNRSQRLGTPALNHSFPAVKLQSLAKNILQESPAVYKDSFIHERFDVLLVSIISIKYNDHKYIRNPTSKIGKQVKIKI